MGVNVYGPTVPLIFFPICSWQELQSCHAHVDVREGSPPTQHVQRVAEGLSTEGHELAGQPLRSGHQWYTGGWDGTGEDCSEHCLPLAPCGGIVGVVNGCGLLLTHPFLYVQHQNTWGPFLIVSPASTLHNWQQEASRFVPRLKVCTPHTSHTLTHSRPHISHTLTHSHRHYRTGVVPLRGKWFASIGTRNSCVKRVLPFTSSSPAINWWTILTKFTFRRLLLLITIKLRLKAVFNLVMIDQLPN